MSRTHLLVSALSALLFFGCCKQGVRFSIKCEGLSPCETYFLSPVNDNTRYYLKTEADKKGVVRFRGRISSPVCASIRTSLGGRVTDFFIEEGKINIAPVNMRLIAGGTPSNDALIEYQKACDSLYVKYDSYADITPEIEKAYQNELDSLGTALWQNNTDKILGVHLFSTEQINVLSDSELSEWFERFTPEMQQHPYMDIVREKLKSSKKNMQKECN